MNSQREFLEAVEQSLGKTTMSYPNAGWRWRQLVTMGAGQAKDYAYVLGQILHGYGMTKAIGQIFNDAQINSQGATADNIGKITRNAVRAGHGEIVFAAAQVVSGQTRAEILAVLRTMGVQLPQAHSSATNGAAQAQSATQPPKNPHMMGPLRANGKTMGGPTQLPPKKP